MKFFHVYNDHHIKGLEKNGLINKETGFKIQHAFSMPKSLKFNEYAAKGTTLYNRIKDEKIPFYVDRIRPNTVKPVKIERDSRRGKVSLRCKS